MQILFMIPIIMFSVVVHECAHGWVADRLGDRTARALGRITLNPIPHIDPIGTLLVPALMYLMSGGRFIFAWAKPVPVNPYNFRDPKRDMMWVSLAGAASNFTLAAGFALLYRLAGLGSGDGGNLASSFFVFLHFGVLINLVLGVFNLIPVPPLDGSKVLMGLLPHEQAAKLARLEPYGHYILLGLMVFGILGLVLRLVVLPLMYLLLGSGPGLW